MAMLREGGWLGLLLEVSIRGEGHVIDLLIMRGKVSRDAFLEDLWQLIVVARIGLWEDDVAHTSAPRRNRLLLDAADGQHAPREGELARHREVGASRAAHGEGEQRGHHRDASRWTVLWCGPFGHMHMERGVLKEAVRRLGRREEGAREGVRDSDTLLHDVAKLTGPDHCTATRAAAAAAVLALTVAVGALSSSSGEMARTDRLRLDVEHGATHGGPRKAGHDP
mmetsp:Transcript_18252/g.36848  ORF Transcript_18252/g.36848 Transcript_18252/m.36848 type:complete len:224 (-) Transcript_18252:161-832(-)